MEFKLPDLGEGVAEAEVQRWLVGEGDEVAEDDPLVEVVTDKVTVEIPSPWTGSVARIHVPAGEVVPVGTVLVTIAGDGDGASLRAPEPAPPTKTRPDPSQREGRGRAPATPPVRRLARELGVDLDAVPASGPDGRVTRADVERYAAAGASTSDVPARAATREPLRGVRRAIAERMTLSHRAIPSVTHVEECDVTELDATRRLVNERDPGTARLTYLPFVVKAVATALGDYPALNATLDDEAEEIVFHADSHIGIAVDTSEGLVVPVIKEAGRKTLRALAREVEDLAERARAGRLTTEEIQSGTFTITSPGAFGGIMATPLILPPQVGILGVHRAEDRPVVRGGQVVIRKVMNLSITFDHRVLDGMTAARFALDVAQLLEHPAVLALDA